ncbi:Outer membrane protein C [Klebsiella variicola]|uniref:porin n=1 Tax=Klebsiella variicola TaxID=244366 RepID=UPI00109D00F5|nr:porin [Klebsiella variicola]VGQ11499.1 Outer membrane protein C [Klebsiella variicola]
MIKKVVAIAVFAALSASAANAAEIYNKNANKLDFYGKVKGERDFTAGKGEDATYARIGLRGETQINDAISGFGQWEYNLNASNAEGSQGEGKTRLAFAGLNFGDAGSLDYGRNYGVVYDIGSYADNLTEFGGDSYQFTDNGMNGRSNGLLTYRNNNFFGLVDGLALGLQYQGANDQGSKRSWDKTNGTGYGASLQYEIADSGATVGAAYSHAEASKAVDSFGTPINTGDAEAWTVGAKYDANAIYLATTYAETRNQTPITAKGYYQTPYGSYDATVFADKTQNIEAMAAYVFDFGLRPSVGYVQSRATIDGFGTVDVTKYVQLGAAYTFNKNFVVDAAYKFNLVKNELKDYGIVTDDQFIVGATYQF